MTIERTLNGKEMILRPEGRLDAITAPELKQLLGETMDSIDSLTRFHAKTLGDYSSSFTALPLRDTIPLSENFPLEASAMPRHYDTQLPLGPLDLTPLSITYKKQ